MATKTEALSPDEMLRRLADGIKRQATAPTMYAYDPHTKQLRFHKAPQKGRLYIGGNRSGKTFGSVMEDIWWLTNTHPYRETPPAPIRGRVVAVDFLRGVGQIILPLFKRLVPPSYLKGGSWEKAYSKEAGVLTFANESTLEFMSYEQSTEKFAGTSRHFIHYDEEPPKHIFNECNARLVDTEGSWWISMTPVEGMTWVYEDIYEPTERGNSKYFVIEADMLDNPFISPEAAEAYLSTLDPEERKAREHGTFVQLGGLVYKRFSRETHTIPSVIPPKEWAWYVSLDHGYNAPTAVLWHAVSPECEIITFGEHYAAELTIEEHARIVKEKNAAFGKEPDFYVADPAIAQRQGVTGTSIQTEYSMRGLYFALGQNDVETGVAKVQMYLRENPKTGKPFRVITENCTNFISEMERLRWKTPSSKKAQFDSNPQEKIHKKNDHACDSDRYFHTFLPDLTPEQLGMPDPEANEPPAGSYAGTPPVGTIDQVLAKMLKSKNNNEKVDTQWTTTYSQDLGALEYE